ncbi:UNVERIFIED_CONTAM: hypothetical protein PYX00_007371 [Menopon gallinae]|uniref:Suppressor of fused homolog n=1 Tax=Menopon gallinae TaxID=328185 RepID=A0AAW2HJF5_9NEOP
MAQENPGLRNPPMNFLPPTPPGLESLYALCRRIYPDQSNPLQVTALVKYWLGGPDPLDYISMYLNAGDASINVPPHWHYVSFGLSDLHGDGRVHEISDPDSPSGFGFELTFRLKREPGETAPPTWPAAVMQALAKYVFSSGNTLCPGDHVSWHCALDNSESRIQHMLMCQDLQLGTAQTPFGSVNFVQIVGITKEELQAAQHWNGPGVLDILKKLPGTGGEWLVTDMRRGESIMELDLNAQEIVERGIETEGSNLSGVSARCSWVEKDFENNYELSNGYYRTQNDLEPRISEQESQQIKSELKKGLLSSKPGSYASIKTEELDELDHIENCRDNPYYNSIAESTELIHMKHLEGVHLTFNLEAGVLLPLAIRGRVKHGRHFTFKSVLSDTAITFVASAVTGTFVNAEHPYASHGPWLQVLIPDDFASEMARDVEVLSQNTEEVALPKSFKWPERKIIITVVPD